MSCSSSEESSRSPSPSIPDTNNNEKENNPILPDKSEGQLKKQIQIIEKQVQKSLRESNINPAARAKFISICSKFERTSPTRSSLADGSVLTRARFFAESPEEREIKEKEMSERRNRFRVTKSSFELYEDSSSTEDDSSSRGSSSVLQSIFHRKDSEKRIQEEMERLRIEEDSKLEQKKAFKEKVSMFGKVN